MCELLIYGGKMSLFLAIAGWVTLLILLLIDPSFFQNGRALLLIPAGLVFLVVLLISLTSIIHASRKDNANKKTQ